MTRRILLACLLAPAITACSAGSARAPEREGARAPTLPAHEDVMPDEAAAMIMKACYADNSAIACTVLAAFFREGSLGYGKNEAKSDELFARAGAIMRSRCDDGEADQCMLFGGLLTLRMLKLPEGDPEILRLAAQAVPALERACRGGEGDACDTLGELHEKGCGVDQDAARADTFYVQACEAGAPRGCMNLGASRIHGGDRPAAAAAYARGCDAAEAKEAARAKEDGAPSPPDKPEKPPWWAEICHEAGYLLIMGDGIPVDAPRAASFYERACRRGSTSACVGLGVLQMRGSTGTVDAARAAGLFRRGCDAGDAGGCALLGHLYDAGEGVPRDAARARALFRKGCDGGDERGCEEIRRLDAPKRVILSPGVY